MRLPPPLATFLGVAGLGALVFGSPAAALSLPDGPLLALDSVNRPVLRELADLKARESERLGKIEDRFDARITRLEESLADASGRSREESAALMRELGSVQGAGLAEIARGDRILLLAVAGGYLWSALLWIELRRATRALRDASVQRRLETAYGRPPPAVAGLDHSGNGRDLHVGVAPPV